MVNEGKRRAIIVSETLLENSMVVFTFSVFLPETPILVNEGKRRAIIVSETLLE